MKITQLLHVKARKMKKDMLVYLSILITYVCLGLTLITLIPGQILIAYVR